ncbi:hypothetical protein D3C75_1136840 [compost metagenome]
MKVAAVKVISVSALNTRPVTDRMMRSLLFSTAKTVVLSRIVRLAVLTAILYMVISQTLLVQPFSQISS